MSCPNWEKCKNFNCHNEQLCMDASFWVEYWRNKYKDVPGHVPVEIKPKEHKNFISVKAAYSGYCYYCERHFGFPPVNGKALIKTIDHIIPVSRGGINHKKNYVDACDRCNHLKADRLPEQFCIHLGFLIDNGSHVGKSTLITILYNTRELIKTIQPYRHELFKFQDAQAAVENVEPVIPKEYPKTLKGVSKDDTKWLEEWEKQYYRQPPINFHEK
jgi:hypothetical protein